MRLLSHNQWLSQQVKKLFYFLTWSLKLWEMFGWPEVLFFLCWELKKECFLKKTCMLAPCKRNHATSWCNKAWAFHTSVSPVAGSPVCIPTMMGTTPERQLASTDIWGKTCGGGNLSTDWHVCPLFCWGISPCFFFPQKSSSLWGWHLRFPHLLHTFSVRCSFLPITGLFLLWNIWEELSRRRDVTQLWTSKRKGRKMDSQRDGFLVWHYGLEKLTK